MDLRDFPPPLFPVISTRLSFLGLRRKLGLRLEMHFRTLYRLEELVKKASKRNRMNGNVEARQLGHRAHAPPIER